MNIFLWLISLAGVLVNALNIGIIWELGIRLALGAQALPFVVCFWVSLLLHGMIHLKAQKVSSDEEIVMLTVVNELINPIIFFVIFGLIYFISRM